MGNKKFPPGGPSCDTCAYEDLGIHEQPCQRCGDAAWKGIYWEAKAKGEKRPEQPPREDDGQPTDQS